MKPWGSATRAIVRPLGPLRSTKIRIMEAEYEQGVSVPHEVLGDDYVHKSTSDVSEFMKPLQDLVAVDC